MKKFNIEDYLDLISMLPGMGELSTYQKVMDILIECYKKKGVVFTMGCGGSASTATHFAADLAKTVGGFKAISLVDNIPLVSAYANDMGWDSIF